jgi:hypothetical protein
MAEIQRDRIEIYDEFRTEKRSISVATSNRSSNIVTGP